MAVTRIETLKEMHLTTDLGEGAEVVAPARVWPTVPACQQARTKIRSPH